MLKTRRSVREYTGEPIPREVIEDIIDCARHAPSAINIQPWAFVVVTDAEARRGIAEIAEHGSHIAQAPVCVAVFCKDGPYFLEEGSAATTYILLAARAHGLGTCWVAGHGKPHADGVAQMLGVPREYRLVSLVSLGRPASIPSPLKRPLAEVLHWEKFRG